MNKITDPRRPPGFEVFMAPLKVSLNPTALEMVNFAYIASKYGHKGQTRDGGDRYFDHPKAAAWIYIDEFGGRDPSLICVILLHDVVEDAYLLSPYRLSLNFDKDIALEVCTLTKLPKGKETTEEYLLRIIKQGPRAIAAKLFDRLHNNRTLDTCTPEKRDAQIIETEKYHLRLLIPALASHDGKWKELARLLETKIKEALSIYK